MGEITLDVLAQMVANGFARVDEAIAAMRTDIGPVQEDLKYLRQEMSLVRTQLDRLEDRVSSHDGYSKEIDALRDRVNKLEQVFGKMA